VYEDGNDDARRVVAGKRIEVSFRDDAGERRDNRYTVPNTNQCGECHGEEDTIDTLGGTTRQWNRVAPDDDVNQIERLIELDWLEGAEPQDDRQALVDPFGAAPVAERMRAYVDANCGHCHNSDDESGDDGSGLWLRYDLTDAERDPEASLGLCKMPQSAGGATCGHLFDVVPGMPDSSIMMCRVESEVAKVQMPPVGRNLRDERGIELLREWIASLDGTCN
jgi:cytochrome c553